MSFWLVLVTHLRVYTQAQIHPSIVTPIPGFNQSAKINPQLIQSHNQAGWSYAILNPPAGKSPALILHLIWNEFTPGCGRNSAEELSDVRRWLSIRMCISIFPILKRFDKPWKARAFSNAPLATSLDSRLFSPPSQILGYCSSSQTPLYCCHAQSCLVHLLSNTIWQQLN